MQLVIGVAVAYVPLAFVDVAQVVVGVTVTYVPLVFVDVVQVVVGVAVAYVPLASVEWSRCIRYGVISYIFVSNGGELAPPEHSQVGSSPGTTGSWLVSMWARGKGGAL